MPAVRHHRSLRAIVLVVSIAVAASCTDRGGTGAATAPRVAPAETAVPANAVVTRVVDGDTIVVEVDGRRETVRLIGIDTPETVKPDAPVECWGPEASSATATMLPEGTSVRLVRDVEARDDYGRLLAYVYRAADGAFVNLDLVRQGFATVLTFPPNTTHADDFVTAAEAAHAAQLGLWAACAG